MTSTIIKNQIKCNLCEDIIESHYRHDFKRCKCGAVSIDGGKDYLKRSAKTRDCFEDLSIVSYRLFKKGDRVLCWGEDKGYVTEDQMMGENPHVKIKLDDGDDVEIDSIDSDLVELLND